MVVGQDYSSHKEGKEKVNHLRFGETITYEEVKKCKPCDFALSTFNRIFGNKIKVTEKILNTLFDIAVCGVSDDVSDDVNIFANNSSYRYINKNIDFIFDILIKNTKNRSEKYMIRKMRYEFLDITTEIIECFDSSGYEGYKHQFVDYVVVLYYYLYFGTEDSKYE